MNDYVAGWPAVRTHSRSFAAHHAGLRRTSYKTDGPTNHATKADHSFHNVLLSNRE
jgi:hypothetical protein